MPTSYSPPLEEPIPLGFLARGQVAEIQHVVGGTEQVQRLHELGIRSGTVVEMLQPGSPCIILLNGHRLCFRPSEVIGILVRPGVPV